MKHAFAEFSFLATALDRWKAGIPWIAEEFRFETMTEARRRLSPIQELRHG